MTPKEIQALSGAELAAAIAKDDGWTHIEYRVFSPNRYRCPTEHHWIGIRPGELFPLVNTEDKLRVLPAYHEGAELGRIVVALMRAGCHIMPDRSSNTGVIVDLPGHAEAGWTIQHKDEVTGILQAYLRLLASREKGDDSHDQMDRNRARIDQMRGGEE